MANQNTARIYQFTPKRRKSKKKLHLVTPASIIKDRLIFSLQHKVLRGKTVKEIVEGTQDSSEFQRPVSQTTIRDWYKPIKEGGTRFPRAHTLARVALAHGYKLDFSKVHSVSDLAELEAEFLTPRD